MINASMFLVIMLKSNRKCSNPLTIKLMFYKNLAFIYSQSEVEKNDPHIQGEEIKHLQSFVDGVKVFLAVIISMLSYYMPLFSKISHRAYVKSIIHSW